MREALEAGEFVITCEVIPGRGANEEPQRRELKTAQAIWATGRVHAISVTDNPSGTPALLADTFARDLLNQGITPLIHFTCKDRSRNQIQSQFYALQRDGLDNLLLMSGDYQTSGWQGRPRPVFDLDPIQALMLAREMNQGLTQHTPHGDVQEQPAHFLAGAVANPFKYTEGETITQYLKLRKKLVAGARFIVSQLGYDARKMEELLLWLRDAGLGATPVIANIFLLNVGAARMMRAGIIAGCHVSDELMAILEEEAKAADKGRAARCLRAAKMIALARGLGYAGVHIGGFGITAEVFSQILDTADEIQDQWHLWQRELCFGQPGGFYVYEPQLDAQGKPTGHSLAQCTPRTEQVRNRALMGGYGLSRFFHYWVLTDGRRLNKLLARVMESRERARGLHRKHGLEHLSKTLLYGCLDCGDCGLEACAYTCPMTSCPKCQRNGPCGGSINGWCEVYPEERYCIWFKAYHRLKKRGALAELERYITVPNNWDFFETSGWSNYTHHRDNAARRIPLDER